MSILALRFIPDSSDDASSGTGMSEEAQMKSGRDTIGSGAVAGPRGADGTYPEPHIDENEGLREPTDSWPGIIIRGHTMIVAYLMN